MIRKLKSGKYRLYSEKKDPKTGKRRNLGTFDTREAAKRHEKEVQFFKRKMTWISMVLRACLTSPRARTTPASRLRSLPAFPHPAGTQPSPVP